MIHETANFYGDGNLPIDNCSIGAFCDIGSHLGDGSKVQCHVSISPGWRLGNRVFYGPGCRFANDKKPKLDAEFIPNGGVVEDDVVIGMGAMIGAGVTLGKGCTVGMGAVVVKDVTPFTLVVGNPAKEI